MRTFAIMALAAMLAMNGVQASDQPAPGKNWNPRQKMDHPSKGGDNPAGNWSPRDHADHPSHAVRHRAPEKEWTPPPGRLPDNVLAGLTFDSDRFHHREQQAVRLNQIGEAPEPGSLLLVGVGLAGLVASRRRKR